MRSTGRPATTRRCSRTPRGRSGHVTASSRLASRSSSIAEREPPETFSPAVQMARDYEDLQNLDQLDDREIRDLVRERLAAHNGLDIDDILVEVKDGAITLSGRV